MTNAQTLEDMSPGLCKGVDGVTKEAHGQNLEANLQGLQARLKTERYRHQPRRRVHIPKARGKTRPIGSSAFEDKPAQDAVREVVEAMYEADMVSFFDSLDRTELKKRLGMRGADGSLMRRMGTCVHVGVLDGETMVEPERGTAQGSVLSPL
jgi:RNA-directed DNA polymerase